MQDERALLCDDCGCEFDPGSVSDPETYRCPECGSLNVERNWALEVWLAVSERPPRPRP